MGSLESTGTYEIPKFSAAKTRTPSRMNMNTGKNTNQQSILNLRPSTKPESKVIVDSITSFPKRSSSLKTVNQHIDYRVTGGDENRDNFRPSTKLDAQFQLGREILHQSKKPTVLALDFPTNSPTSEPTEIITNLPSKNVLSSISRVKPVISTE